MVNVSVLVAIVSDGQVDWYEAIVLGVLYVTYFIVMFNSVRLFGLIYRVVARVTGKEDADSKYTFIWYINVLVAIVWDGQVDWYEAIVLGVLYVTYFIVMFNSVRLFGLIDRVVARVTGKEDADISDSTVVIGDMNKSYEDGIDNKAFDQRNVVNGLPANPEKPAAVVAGEKSEEKEVEEQQSLWQFPRDKSTLGKIWFCYSWPLRVILSFTIPNVITCRKFYPLAFCMCIVWIGVNSYFVTWSMTVIGYTLFIPESVMGMTFLAFGGCLPEACSIFIMSRRGEGGIGVSNALGANSLAILFALGLPWLIRTLVLVGQGAEETAVLINSAGIDFVVGSLLIAVSCLWITLFIGKFTLRKSIGFFLFALYLIFIVFAILVETGIILERTAYSFALC
ncbi:sodium/calcium exchanger protein domain-containing protein [Phthorimaea operculella]|nr:sodium/calcium exchanger protein domain-containing protein [Phthorimaea operculella]